MFAQGDRRRAGVQDGGGGEVRGEHVWVDLHHVHFDVDGNTYDDDDVYDSMSDLGEIRVYQRADFQSGSRVLKKVF